MLHPSHHRGHDGLYCPVAGRFRGNAHRGEDRHTALKQTAQRAGKTRTLQPGGQGPDHRQPEHQAIHDQTRPSLTQDHPYRSQGDGHPHKQGPPITAHKTTKGEQHARDRGQFLTERFKEHLEAWNHESDQAEYSQGAYQQQKSGIYKSPNNLAAQTGPHWPNNRPTA